MTKRPLAICRGHQGDWLVDVTIGGKTEKLPTAHKYFVRHGNEGMVYDRADVAWLDVAGKGSQWLDVARNAKRVVLTDDDVTASGNSERPFRFTRKGYIGVFAIGEIVVSDNGVRFRFMARIADCAG